MKYFLVTGELSGAKICAQLIEPISEQDSDAIIYAMGNPILKDAGANVLINIEGTRSVMGFTGLMSNIWFYKNLSTSLKTQIKRIDPDIIIFCDFAGFNLPMCRWAKKQGYKTIYIAPPKTWASRPYRNKFLATSTDDIVVLFPFEQDYFQSVGIKAQFYGHPLVFNRAQKRPTAKVKYNIILIAPGSRPQELRHTLPKIKGVMNLLDDYHFVISKAPSITYEDITNHLSDVHIDRYHISEASLNDLLQQVDLAIITSGTATFEAAMANTPQIVVYNTSSINYWIAKRLIKAPYISLPNLILNRQVVPELIQHDLTTDRLTQQINDLFSDSTKQMKDYQEIQSIYNQHHSCSHQMAKTIIDRAK